ncbi:Transcriptional regulatory protein WalR [compost metagenome]|uniref:response regulator n=1 Tax=Sphingobacterium sp. TaxID=341027 RepID=UPI000FB4C58D|nr:response regulator [Sphingobacterium sp.]
MTKKKAIVIQDNEDILNIMDEVLVDEGFDVIPSLTTEPIEELAAIDPDILIVDDHIKGRKKGSEVIKEIKNDPETEELPSVLTSTANDIAQVAAECKADDFIEKPFDLDHMVNVVKRNSE